MIHVEQLTIHEFRGIRDLTIDLKRKNFAICGPNGTGKSGIVDALEFVLSGSVSRLSGKGRGDLSIKAHGPHVDCKLPEEAYASAVLWVPSLLQKMEVKRTVKSPKTAILSPDTPETRKILAYLENHPELSLSRREITSYVLSEPGQRSKDIQALLKLEKINTLRLRFQKIAKDATNSEKTCEQQKRQAEEALSRALGISVITGTAVLAAANAQRKILQLDPIADLKADTSLKDGIRATVVGTAEPRLNKAVAAGDAAAAIQALKDRASDSFKESVNLAVASVDTLAADASLLDAVTRDNFLSVALELFDGEFCPACDSPHAADEFIAIIGGKREKLAHVKKLRSEAEGLISRIIEKLELDRDLLRATWPHTKILLPPADSDAFRESGVLLNEQIEKLRAFLPLNITGQVLGKLQNTEAATGVLERLATAIAALPEPTAQDAATEILTIAQERLDTVRSVSAAHRGASLFASQAARVSEIYVTESEKALEDVYSQVQSRFANLYRKLNSDDESDFEAEMKQDKASLDFKVDFYKRGKFPPGAFHSEGHQDSMGLCLYLALMQHLQGDRFTFAVLDDVLMSVDTGHRREVSKMLRSEFPGTQFVLTTHDPVWLKYMQTSGLVDGKNQIRFRKWSVDTGPSVWVDSDIWNEIDEAVRNNQIREAAAALRNYLEYVTGEVCQALRAKVTFNADGRYDLGDLLDPAINRMKELLADAKKAAESWNDAAKVALIEERRRLLDIAAQSASSEQWQMNPAVHYNEWANLNATDFGPVVAAYKNLVSVLHCPKCSSLYEIVPPRGSKEHLLCACGTDTLSFHRKSKAVAA